MKMSHSRVESYTFCPFKYKLRYIDKLETYDEYDALSPLILGTVMHTGIEKGVKEAIKEYYDSYPIITDAHIEEAIKLEYLIPKVIELLPPGGKFEVKITSETFVGFIDYLYPLEDGTWGIIDFKYSNKKDKYSESNQLHIYKFYGEKFLNIKISKLQFLMIPKVSIKLKKTENQFQFRQRILEELSKKQIDFIDVIYDKEKVKDYLISALFINRTSLFIKNQTPTCKMFCEYADYCLEGNSYNIKEELNMLPSTQRVEVNPNNFVKIYVYGAPFSGKTTLADQAPTPLNLNTDGNVKYVTMPRIAIMDEVKTEGRITKRKFAWEIFKDTILELEKGSDFKTLAVDLVDDMYEHCRLYSYDKLGIEHESDNSFKAWDYVRTEFLSTMKRLLNLPYNIILISHEDTSRDITKKTGDKITSIKPNIPEKIANKLAGMVDLVARVVVDGDNRKLSFKNSEVIFGGGRLKTEVSECNLSWNSLMNVYNKAIRYTTGNLTEHQKKVEAFKEEHAVKEIVEVDNPVVEVVTEVVEPTPVRRTRRVRE